MSDSRLLILHGGPSPERIDLLLFQHWQKEFPEQPPVSRKKIKEAIEAGLIRIQGKALKASLIVEPGRECQIEIQENLFQSLTVLPPQSGGLLPAYSGPPLERIFENDTLCVYQKLSGVPSVPHSWEDTRSCVHQFLQHHPECLGVGRGGLESGILHRLDTLTSGCLVFAKTTEEFERIRALWKRPALQEDAECVRKTYRAIVRVPEEQRAAVLRTFESQTLPRLIDTPIGHDAKSQKKMRALLVPERDRARMRGEPLEARTHLLAAQEIRPGTWDLTLEIDTGVMHQIRVHCAQVLGAALLGDPIYGGLPSSRLWLHAWHVSLPLAGEVGGQDRRSLQLEAPLPSLWPTSASSQKD
jgi:23S rRNA pseudouridine1911/1915/1917 synthase